MRRFGRSGQITPTDVGNRTAWGSVGKSGPCGPAPPPPRADRAEGGVMSGRRRLYRQRSISRCFLSCFENSLRS